MLIRQGSFRVCKNHDVILLILLTLLEKLATLLNLFKKSTTFKNFTWARAQVCSVRPTPMYIYIYIYIYFDNLIKHSINKCVKF